MTRLMAVSLTERQVVAREKTVTRRLGWLNLVPGTRLTLCRKVMGRKRRDGSVEPLVKLVDVRVVSVGRERLDAITQAECDAEGFPDMCPAEFVEFFCRSHKGCTPETKVTRIEWVYLPLCTGLSASWCPNHGDCRCPRLLLVPGEPVGDRLDDDRCPLHSRSSDHASGPVADVSGWT